MKKPFNAEAQRRLTSARILANQVRVELEEIFSARTGKEIRFSVKDDDLLRLLNLRRAVIRYKLPLSRIIDLLTEIYASMIAAAAKRGKPFRNGILPLPYLVSVSAHQKLEQRISELYPDQENITGWKSTQRLLQICDSIPEDGYDDPLRFGVDYQKRLKTTRSHLLRLESMGKIRRYRDNIWVD